MTIPRLPTRLLLLALATVTAQAQTTVPAPAARKPHPKAQSPYNPNLILLDPAHGGSDNGAKLASDPDFFEKDATIALAGRLKTLLTGRGFVVTLTHEAASDQLAPDARAELANRSRAVACVLLHASNGGHGVHVYTSSLPPALTLVSDADESHPVLAWNSAQTASLDQSNKLAGALADALAASRIPLVAGHASVAPIDSMICPAVAVELSPLAAAAEDGLPIPASNAAYQDRIAGAIADALTNWRTHIVAEIAAANAAANPPAAAPAKPAITPPPVHKPRPAPIPVETPASTPPKGGPQ